MNKTPRSAPRIKRPANVSDLASIVYLETVLFIAVCPTPTPVQKDKRRDALIAYGITYEGRKTCGKTSIASRVGNIIAMAAAKRIEKSPATVSNLCSNA